MFRIAGVHAEEENLFVPVPGYAAYQVLNPAFFGRYFNDAFVSEVAYEPFLREKPDDVFRVMVLGGSSVAGFPYRFYLGFPAWLRHRLEAEAVGQRIEVVNVGITAASSYTFWDIRKELAAQRPDAVLIYAGHNEYYGAFGAGSSINVPGNAIGLKRLVLRLKRLVLYRSLERFLRSLLPKPEGTGRTLMARMIRDAGITYDSDTYRAGIEQFEANMRDVLMTFRRAGYSRLYGNAGIQPQGSAPPRAGSGGAGCLRTGSRSAATGRHGRRPAGPSSRPKNGIPSGFVRPGHSTT
ncbi:MAG: hypothetical protein KatS3mg043_1077 [Rhodothermaceae bacterium]|nr:MAG: hypothetical protein KatS3mg043_1077 [Rhodothermaceae bacterium]